MQQVHTLNIQQIQKKINPLCGQRCFEASLSYGEELHLEFGREHIILTTPKFIIKRGDWSLGTRGSNWTLTNQEELVVSSDANCSYETVRKQITQLENKLVTSYKVNTDGGLQINFDGHYTLKICPSFDDSEDALAYWELLTPNHKVLEVKSKTKGHIVWSYLPSNGLISS